MSEPPCPKCGGAWKKTKNYRYWCGQCYTDASRRSHLAKSYGITLEDYDAMVEAQGNLCAICGKPETATFTKKSNSGIKRLAVDHCHDTGEVRGLLCAGCNTGLGYFRDNAEALQAASDYIQVHKS